MKALLARLGYWLVRRYGAPVYIAPPSRRNWVGLTTAENIDDTDAERAFQALQHTISCGVPVVGHAEWVKGETVHKSFKVV